jgi:arylsulfatase A-like enzyme
LNPSKRRISYLLSLSILAILGYWIVSKTPPAARSVAASNQSGDANVVFISIDSLRPDHLSCYGYARKTSPNIDRLAREGVLFSNAFSTSSWTLPAHLSMLTSLYSLSHGVLTGNYSLDPERITLAEVLKKQGYATAGFVSAPYMDSIYGFDQGFDLYDDSINGTGKKENRHGHKQITSPLLNNSIKKWLSENHQKRFFLFLHYFDVHYDYVPPSPFDTMFDPDYTGNVDARKYSSNQTIRYQMNSRDLAHIIALYDGEIAFTDHHVGEIFSSLRELNIYENTLIVLTSDHGEEFFEHGRKGHRHTLYDEVLRVPLIIKLPESRKQSHKMDQLVSLVDIMPTVLNALGLKPPEESQGRNLLDPNRPSDSFVYSRLQQKLVSVRSSHAKLIRDLKKRNHEFYNLIKDPEEKLNLFDQASIADLPEAKKHLFSLLDWLSIQQHVSQTLPRGKKNNKVKIDEGMKEQLEALGYIQ